MRGARQAHADLLSSQLRPSLDGMNHQPRPLVRQARRQRAQGIEREERIWVDGAAGRQATAQQQQWINATTGQISAHSEGQVAVASAAQNEAQIMANGDALAGPTRSFLQILGISKRGG